MALEAEITSFKAEQQQQNECSKITEMVCIAILVFRDYVILSKQNIGVLLFRVYFGSIQYVLNKPERR